MKASLIALLALTTSCAYIPKRHDPAEMLLLTELRVDLDYVSCDNPQTGWLTVERDAKKIALYATERKELQASTLQNVVQNIQTARTSESLCQATLDLARLNTDIVISSWSSRRR